ncbi:glycyl-tRNA synthetase beta chain [Colwellia chukchiensis]|uniref:Glycine--tRNA ligase beta subunit n=1 Tax=Colwellia chukchiensis TaxID=641665 RepID=A0A1H7PHH6_9GAMM|nr:glycine--tRNA ligase subunit beta [Colwellia chukchiensis]SEL35241.1 glycyl-tRNA synthetase beta chain [Colwellia chukchiensis]
MTTDTLLIELGTEELPPKSLKTLAVTFYQQIKTQLDAAQLAYNEMHWYATPRRLAVQVTGLVACQADKAIEKRGPAVTVAFDSDGNASKAAQGWARSNGITVDEAERLVTDKGEWLLHKTIEPGKHVEQLIPEMVKVAINKLPVPKPMRWGAGRTQFIRPVHSLTMLYGDKIIAGEALNVKANNLVTGHRFHHHGLVAIENADSYVAQLRDAHVVVDYQERKQTIKREIELAAQALGGEVSEDEDLLDEVTSIVEWPVVLVGSFDEAFLNVPAEPLIYSMKDHQKYFPVFGKDGKLLNKFIFVANIASKDASQVIKGNEKVIRPRLADAEFFFKTDKKQTLESRLEHLESVLFQKQLGTVKAKSTRIASLSEFIAEKIGEDSRLAYRAGLLSKTDLLSDMVQEFPQVQGTMGKYYAQSDGEAPAVAQALEDQYLPRYAGDKLPAQNIGCAVAIADKVDTLVGIFGIGQPPKGDKDPFALRRAAIGLLRIIIEKQLTLDISELVKQSIDLYQDKLSNQDVATQVLEFVLGRYRAYYQDQNISIDVIQAVLANAPTEPLDFDKRIHAVSHFKALAEAATLAAANKRVGNILVKFDGELFPAFKRDVASETAELELADTFSAVNAKVAPLLAVKNYQSALTELAALKQAIDNFFDHVMVMDKDPQVKTNRLTLLNEIRNRFLAIADISLLQS